MEELLKYLKPILEIGNKPTDTEDIKREHGFLIYMGLLMSIGGFFWGTLCLLGNMYIPAIVPYTYIVLTAVNFFYLYKTKNFIISQNVQIFISLILPFFFQFFLGGFVASGGNVLWSVLAVFGSFTLGRKKSTITWLVMFILIMIVSGVVDSQAQKFDAGLPESYVIFFFVINFIAVVSIIFSLYYYFVTIENATRKNLQKSLEELHLAQEQLIAKEKMASLGSLVSGVAHEINTPLGVGLTGISQIDQEVKKMESNYHSDSLTEDALLGSISTIGQLTQTIRDRLNNAVTLVKSFKNISVDQHAEDKREFVLKRYIDDLILSLQGPLKSKGVVVVNNIDESIVLDSYPGIFSQIVSNLILNSIAHGFEEGSENSIEISVNLDEGFKILYRDNGIGITDEVEKKIFDPFFTTKRGQGGSGLGMNIIYNLITQKLKGNIALKRMSPNGLGFDILLDLSHTKA